MFKKTVLTLSGVLLLANSSFAQSNPTDWTPVFKSWENGCTHNPILTKFVDYGISNGDIALPENLKASVGARNEEQGEEWTNYEFALINSTYYGLPIEKLVAYRGNGNGIKGHTLVLNATAETAKKALAKVQYKKISEDGNDYQVDVSSEKGQTFVTCDESM